MKTNLYSGLFVLMLLTVFGCNHNPSKPKEEAKPAEVAYRGLYSFGPEVKSFKDCTTGQEYWAADSSAQLELSYSQLHFEKPYEPVYVEIEGRKVKSGKDGAASEFDSTFVVKKLIKISKDIPTDMCREVEAPKAKAESKK
jgi:copper homeostasis protein (lipoprotein)